MNNTLIFNSNEKEIKDNEEPKEIYFLILYERSEKEDEKNFVFRKCDKEPKNIYTKEIMEKGKNKSYLYKKVFKVIKQPKKKEETKNDNDKKKLEEEEIELQFEIGKDNYIISFNVDDKFFYYDIELKHGNKYLTKIDKEIIDQNILDYYEKFEIYLEALNKNKDEARIEILYDEIIKLYSKKKDFSFLIKLFIKIYDKKNLCIKLIKEFYNINKDKTKKKNINGKENLNYYISTFSNISSEADNLIKNNGYDAIQFYGIILCYLNHYDYENYQKYFKKLYFNKCEILYEILLIYNSNILKPIEQDSEFFIKFIVYTISKKEFDYFENLLNFISDIETYIIAIDNTKEKIVEKYKNDFKTLKMKANLRLKKRKEGEEMNIIISSIKSIINFSKEKEILLIYFSSSFWKYILKYYNEPNDININICFKLREIFISYNDLVNILFDDTNNVKIDKDNYEIKNDINKYFILDEFAFLLDKNIKIYCEINKDISNNEILGLISQYDPYFKEDKYASKREVNIFDYINFEKIDKQFIEKFRKHKFEIIFKDNITNFLDKLISKTDHFFKFGIIIDLIDIRRINKQKVYLSHLKQKYENIIKSEINSLTGKSLTEAIKIISKFARFLFIQEKNCDFLEQKIDKLNKYVNINISPLIYIELIRKCQDEEYQPLKEFIYKKYLIRIDNINNIISLIDSLSKKDKIKFFEKLMKKCEFTREEFYSKYKNTKIILLCELHDKGKLEISNENNFYGNIEDILCKIRKDMDGNISKQRLEEFLENGKDIVIKRLGLIKIILADYEPEKVYNEKKVELDKINEDIKELTSIKNSLLIFHKYKYLKEIKTITEIIEEIQEKTIKNYNNQRMKISIELKELKKVCEKINKVKDLILFKVIYDEAYGRDQNKRFNEGINKLDKIQSLLDKDNYNIKEIYKDNQKIFDKIKNIVSKNESNADLIIYQMIDYYLDKMEGITEAKEIKEEKRKKMKEEKKELIDDLIIIFKSKKYEIDLKSINFFFENFNPNDKTWIEKLPKEYETLSKMDLEELKNHLKVLKDNKIYDYTQKSNYFKLFTSLYEKKEAINFLLSKTDKDIKYLYDRIEPTNRTLTIKTIEDCEKCINIFKIFKEYKNNFDLFEYIKQEFNKDNEQISIFESYSKNYVSIIELDRNDGLSFKFFENVNNIIKNACFIFKQDNEDFCYGKNKSKTNMKELINLKNKIHIKFQREKEEDIVQIKCQKLIFFKENISNLEKIYDDMKVLQTKGSSLPILIIIKIEYPNITYSLNKMEANFEDIKDFLFRAKTEHIAQMDLLYKENKYLRFLYGKQFRRIIKHLDGEANIFEIMRYILNKTNNKENIIEGEVSNPKIADDYVEQYKKYNYKSFQNISNYITSLFEKNETSLQKHYEDMLIKNKNKYKGFYLHKCENGELIEDFILNIFFDKIGHIPLAQNVLIFSEETSPEEIQAFFYRSILCDYNTLFVVELNNSLSDFQQNIMYSYIDSILSYKNKIYNESEKQNIDKNKTNIYLKSCIVFVYDENIKDNSFLVQLGKVDIQKINIEKLDNNTKENKFKNVTIITSDICGLGKSHKIKKMIEIDKKQYYHFPLGGILTKTIIFEKLSSILKIINKEKGDNYEKISIHLDLTESKETNIINEFLFSFLITKFYINNENIIFIPKDIQIYIEIPNCFKNYLSKLGIIKIFNCENISLDNIPNLDLSKEIIDIFSQMLEFKSKEEIEKFIGKYIDIKKCSFHQIQIFIKLFISQYNKFKNKLHFLSGKKEYIQEFANRIKYFTVGGFADLHIKKNDYKNQGYIELFSNIYENILEGIKFDIPMTFKVNEEMKYIQLKILEKDSTEYKDSKDYLNEIKSVLNLPNDIEKDIGNKKSLISILNYKTDNYVITEDNFKKMILLFYRIKANIPVIIMGETGCGKTALITKLNQILNNGEITIRTINIYKGLNDKEICNKLAIINEYAKEVKDEIWVFFDEINTCLSFSLLTEIFINRTYNGEKLNENIRLIGACNPYRKRKAKTEKYGLSIVDDNENELVYLVQPLPQSLLYYAFYFGLINEADEKKYIYNIIEKLFKNEEKKLHEITRDAIFESHKFLRETFDPSVVSLREISRFCKCVEFLQKYFSIKDEYLNIDINGKEKLFKIKSIICSIYLCYYIRLNDDQKRAKFDVKLKEILLKLVNIAQEPKIDEKYEEKEGNLFYKINYKELKDDLREKTINQFSDLLRIEEEFLLNLIELDKGIGKNNFLKENIFLLFLSVITKIPLIIIGKPGTGKSLSAKLIYKSMKGKYSKEKFFRKFPQIIQTYFQGSESTNPEDVEKLFQMAESKYKYFHEQKEIKKEDLPISMIFYDELGLAEKSETNPLKVLHSKLEYDGNNEGVSFIGISNYSLDAVKINRALILSVPNLEERIDQLINTSKSIVESISENLIKNQKQVFDILAIAYYEYKNILKILKELTVLKMFYLKNKESKTPIDLLQKDFKEISRMKEYINLYKKEKKINEDFHGNRDLYNFIKEIAIETGRLNTFEDNYATEIIEKYIERNFGGIDYEIDIDFKFELNDIKTQIDYIKKMLKGIITYKRGQRNKDNKNKKDEKIKVSSVFLFKKAYNKACGNENQYKIKDENCKKYDLNKCIFDNINDSNNPRYLLLEIKPSLSSLIYQIIKIQNPDKAIEFYDGSPFIDDNNNEYRFKKVNEIQDDAKSDKLIILQNLDQIQPFLFDLYDKNYIIKDEQKYFRICLNNCSEQLIPLNDSFRIIILMDRKKDQEVDMDFLNRLEKTKITFDKLLDDEESKLAKRINDELNLKLYIDQFQKASRYNLKNLLINCGKEETEGLIFNLCFEIKKIFNLFFEKKKKKI